MIHRQTDRQTDRQMDINIIKTLYSTINSRVDVCVATKCWKRLFDVAVEFPELLSPDEGLILIVMFVFECYSSLATRGSGNSKNHHYRNANVLYSNTVAGLKKLDTPFLQTARKDLNLIL